MSRERSARRLGQWKGDFVMITSLTTARCKSPYTLLTSTHIEVNVRMNIVAVVVLPMLQWFAAEVQSHVSKVSTSSFEILLVALPPRHQSLSPAAHFSQHVGHLHDAEIDQQSFSLAAPSQIRQGKQLDRYCRHQHILILLLQNMFTLSVIDLSNSEPANTQLPSGNEI